VPFANLAKGNALRGGASARRLGGGGGGGGGGGSGAPEQMLLNHRRASAANVAFGVAGDCFHVVYPVHEHTLNPV
jgi:hypothetical protein